METVTSVPFSLRLCRLQKPRSGPIFSLEETACLARVRYPTWFLPPSFSPVPRPSARAPHPPPFARNLSEASVFGRPSGAPRAGLLPLRSWPPLRRRKRLLHRNIPVDHHVP